MAKWGCPESIAGSIRQILVVFFCLLVTTTLFSAAAIGAASPKPESSVSPTAIDTGAEISDSINSSVLNDPSEYTARARKRVALEYVGRLDGAERLNQTEQILVDRVRSNISDAAYWGPNRTGSVAPHIADADAAAALTDAIVLNGSSATENSSYNASQVQNYYDVGNATLLLASADNTSTRLAIADAERAVSILKARNSSRLTESEWESIEENITKAKQAYQEAQLHLTEARAHRATAYSLMSPAGLENPLPPWVNDTAFYLKSAAEDRVRALRDMVRARDYTYFAIRELSRRGYSTLHITNDIDPAYYWRHEGNFTKPTNGTVFVVNPDEFEYIDLGLRDRKIPLDKPSRPASNATFSTNITLFNDGNQTVNLVDMAAKPESATSPERFYWYDGDGLPRFYEESIGTDPKELDSDSTDTETDEGGNRIIDGQEDFDDDGVTSAIEWRANTSATDADSDDDNLVDGPEIRMPGLDPHSADSDGDGIPDAVDDLDGDGLTNQEEYEAGLHLALADTDQDGIDDAAELNRSLNATNPDTDGDGLMDGAELELGTDPSNPDSDGDGTVDGNARYTTTLVGSDLNTTIEFTGDGNVADKASLHRARLGIVSGDPLTNASVSDPVTFGASRDFEWARVTIRYNESKLDSGSEENLTIYRYAEDDQTFRPVGTVIDTANNTVLTEVLSGSTLVVMQPAVWEEEFSGMPSSWGNSTEYDSGDVVSCEASCQSDNGTLVISSGTSSSGSTSSLSSGPVGATSGSMYSVDYYYYVSPAYSRASSVIGQSSSDHHTPEPDCEITDPDQEYCTDPTPTPTPTPTQSPTPTPTATDGGGGGGGGGGGDDGGSDGGDSGSTIVTRNATITTYQFQDHTNIIEFNTTVRGYVKNSSSTVRLYLDGESHEHTLFSLSSSSGSKQSDWQVVVDNISSFRGETVDLRAQIEGGGEIEIDYTNVRRNTDGDKFWDRTERMGLPTGSGERTPPLDPTRKDTDDDGLQDGAEAFKLLSSGPGGEEYYFLLSDPTALDTDGEGLDDYEEQHVWDSDPLRRDTDLDGFSDFVDPAINSNDAPPTIYNVTSQDFTTYIDVLLPTSIDRENITVNASFSGYGGPFWKQSTYKTKRGETDTGTWWYIQIPTSTYNHHADKYFLNVTDSGNDTNSVLLRPRQEESASARVVSAGATFVSVGGTTTFSNEPKKYATRFAVQKAGSAARVAVRYGSRAGAYGLALYAGIRTTAFVLSLDDAGSASISEYTISGVPATSIEAEYSADQTHPDLGRIVLYSGEIAQATGPNGRTYTRGYGYEYISTVTSTTQTQISTLLTDGESEVYTYGQGTRVIGDPQKEQLIATILGGIALMSGNSYAMDPCQEIVDVEHEEEHATRKVKPFEDKSHLKKAIEEGTRRIVETAAGKRYYIVKVAGGFGVIVTQPAGSDPAFTYTAYYVTSTLDDVYNKLKAHMEYIEDTSGDYEIIYDSKTNPDC